MDTITALIQESQNWTSMDRGRQVVESFFGFLQRNFHIDVGLLRYRKIPPTGMTEFPGDDELVFRTWGLNYSDDQLIQFDASTRHLMEQTGLPHDKWFHTHELPTLWQEVLAIDEISQVGIWQLTTHGKLCGVLSLGHKAPVNESDAVTISLCVNLFATHLEMLMLRRTAEELSIRDPLTKLLNRRGFMDKFERLTQQSNGHIVVGIVDVNNLKTINDRRGHLKGDEALQRVATILQDNVGQHGLCARFGGDEFVFAIETDDTNHDASALKYSGWFNEQWFSTSVGCAVWGPDTDLSSCLQRADRRLYSMKTRKPLIAP